ncbi:MAG: hypothetical protein HWN67_21700 [Candidatus Helarchaeota archaeon]|nr:hypothetical protein [Candidatus Helarchaeota archaeon]
MSQLLEDQIKIKKYRINPFLSVIFSFFCIVISFLIGLLTIKFLQSPIKHYPNVFLPLNLYSDIVLFSNIAVIFLVTGMIFFLWFGLGTQKCNINTYGFGFGVPGALILCICLTLNFSYLYDPMSLISALLSLICFFTEVVLFIFRHKVDADIIYQLMPLNDKINEIELRKINWPYGILRLQRAISRGIRAQYLNPLFYLDKEKLARARIGIINKKYLYKNVHASYAFGIIGYFISFISTIFLILYFIFGIYLLVTFFIVLGVGITLVDYYYIRRLNLRKTILIIDHWLRRIVEVDLAKIDKEFGFLPIKYPISALKHISKRYESFLGAKLTNNKLIKENID